MNDGDVCTGGNTMESVNAMSLDSVTTNHNMESSICSEENASLPPPYSEGGYGKESSICKKC